MKNRLECMQPIRFLVVLLMCCLSYTTWAQTQSNAICICLCINTITSNCFPLFPCYLMTIKASSS